MTRHLPTATLAIAIAVTLSACNTPAPSPPPAAVDTRLSWWREARFGLFVHWGLYALPAGEWNGRTDYGEWIRDSAQIPLAKYDELQRQWNPVKFDADEWVRLAKGAGMRYVVFTTKHHDGFCLFDSAQTEFDVMGSPWRRDAVAELTAACRRQSVHIGFYHSIMDWHHPDYLPHRSWETEADRPAAGARFPRYVEYLQRQVAELLNHYGPDLLWFDGEWESTWTHEQGRELYNLCRSLRPEVIVNNRVDKGRGGMEGMTRGEDFVGDYGTPEQEVPAAGLPGVDWETCMTMGRHWGWNRADTAWKTSTELIRTLIDVTSKGGNLLLNVGPRADGTFPPAAIERLRDIGAWMAVHGEAIWGTQQSPFAAIPWGRCTWKPVAGDADLFLHVFDWPADGRLLLDGLGSEVLGAERMATVPAPVAYTHRDGMLSLQLPTTRTNPHAEVVRVHLRGAPLVYRAPVITAAAPFFVQSMPVRVEAADGLEVHVTTDGSEPTAASPLASAELQLAASATVQARAFHRGRSVTSIVARRFERVAAQPPVTPANLLPGLSVATWRGQRGQPFDRLPDFSQLPPAPIRTTDCIELPPGPSEEYVARTFTGYLRVPADDVYTFALLSDDGSRLLLDGEVTIDLDGLHSAAQKTGQVALAAGLHPLRVEWFNKEGGAELVLKWAPAGRDLQPVPASALVH